jgi:predicted aspartyl protease
MATIRPRYSKDEFARRGDEIYGRQRIEAIIDTGYDGWLSLAPATTALLGLPWRRRSRAQLADGSESLLDIFEGLVNWDRRRRIPIDEIDISPLVGMAQLDGYELSVRVCDGGKVTIQRLSS